MKLMQKTPDKKKKNRKILRFYIFTCYSFSFFFRWLAALDRFETPCRVLLMENHGLKDETGFRQGSGINQYANEA